MKIMSDKMINGIKTFFAGLAVGVVMALVGLFIFLIGPILDKYDEKIAAMKNPPTVVTNPDCGSCKKVKPK